MTLAVTIAVGASAVGIAAAFWSVAPVAGGVAIVMTAAATVLIVAYRRSLDKANPRPQAPGSSGINARWNGGR